MRVTYTFILMLLVQHALPQAKSIYALDSTQLTTLTVETIQLQQENANNKTFPIKKLPFRFVDVKDVRYDTSNIGVVVRKLGFRRLQFSAPASTAIKQYLSNNSLFSLDSSGYPLVCYLKKCRYSQNMYYDKYTNKVETGSAFELEIEAFVFANDALLPAFRLDTLIVRNPGNKLINNAVPML